MWIRKKTQLFSQRRSSNSSATVKSTDLGGLFYTFVYQSLNIAFTQSYRWNRWRRNSMVTCAAKKHFCSRPRSLTLSLIPVKLFPTSSGSWSDFITWTTLKIHDWLIWWFETKYKCLCSVIRLQVVSIWQVTPPVTDSNARGQTSRVQQRDYNSDNDVYGQ